MNCEPLYLTLVRLHRRSTKTPRKLGILPGSFNPLTIAHLEIAQAAAKYVDEVLLVVPSALPHKEYFGATLEERVAMIEESGLAVPHSIASTERGLFIEIARDARELYGAELYLLCGRDAAERILGWDYGRPGVVEEMLSEFELLVAPRGGPFTPPVEFQHRIHALTLAGNHEMVSSSEIRERMKRGERWEHLVPEAIVERVRKIYS